MTIKYPTDLGIVTHQYSNTRNMISSSGYSLKMSNNYRCKGVIFSLFIFAQVYSMSFLSYTHLFTPLRNSKSFAPSGTEKTLMTVPCNIIEKGFTTEKCRHARGLHCGFYCIEYIEKLNSKQAYSGAWYEK